MKPASVDAEMRSLVDDYRARCLWFLREDYYPTTGPEWDRVLRLIERHGDLQAFRRAADVRAWLSHRSSDVSVTS